ncbi:hypothetical protein Tco_0411313 [Tanacetum coccineum]
MTTLAEFMIISGADNHPPMLEKSMTKKCEELSVTAKLQADCDLKATNIVLQGLAVPVFTQGDDPIVCLNKVMAFLSVVAASRFPSTNNQLRTSSNPRNQATIIDGREGRQGLLNAIIVKVMLAEAQESGQILDEEQLAFLAAFQTEDLDAYDSDCDDVSNAKASLMANLSKYGSDVISEVLHSEPYHNDMDNQSVHAMHDFEQTTVVDFPDNEITSDSNIILYSRYLQETQQAAVQDTNLYAQQD